MTVVFREAALRSLARIRSDDKEAFTQVRRTIAVLADQPQVRTWTTPVGRRYLTTPSAYP